MRITFLVMQDTDDGENYYHAILDPIPENSEMRERHPYARCGGASALEATANLACVLRDEEQEREQV